MRRTQAGCLSRVAQLLVPDGRAPFRGEVEQVPDRLEGADVTRILVRVGWCVEELGAPEVADRLAVAVKYVQHRPLLALRGLPEVVALVAVVGRGEQAQPSPPALLGEGEDPRRRCLRDDREIDERRRVLSRAVELIQKRHARRAGPLSGW